MHVLSVILSQKEFIFEYKHFIFYFGDAAV